VAVFDAVSAPTTARRASITELVLTLGDVP
jgi:hypothetical protein